MASYDATTLEELTMLQAFSWIGRMFRSLDNLFYIVERTTEVLKSEADKAFAEAQGSNAQAKAE